MTYDLSDAKKILPCLSREWRSGYDVWNRVKRLGVFDKVHYSSIMRMLGLLKEAGVVECLFTPPSVRWRKK